MRFPHLSTVADFIRWEEQQNARYEFSEGLVSLLPGALRRHETIQMNVSSALRVALGPGVVNTSGLKVVMENSSRYPDVLVSFDPRDRDDLPSLRYPTMLVEILSKSTNATDRGPKFYEYRAIETLREYVLIDSRKRWVQSIRRSGDEWVVSVPVVEGNVRFASVDVAISIAEIYAGTTL